MLKGNNTKKQHAKKQQLKKQHVKKHRQKSNSIIWVTRYRPTVTLPADIDQLNFDTY